MEEHDVQLIEQLVVENAELASLWSEHLDFEKKLEELNGRLYLTPEEQLERKRLQKEKLLGRDRIEAILADYRTQAANG